MGKAVKAVTKVVAKIAPYAMAAYGGYQFMGGQGIFGGSNILSSGNFTGKFVPKLLTQTAQPSLGIGQTLSAAASKIGSYITANPLSSAGMALQGVGYVQQRKAQSAQAEALESQARAEAEQRRMQERYQETLARRQRLDLLRQQRIMSGRYQTSAASAGLGAGTSGLLGATSSIQTQTTANIGAIDFAEGASKAISNQAQLAADAGTAYYQARGQESMWSGLTNFGGSLYSTEDLKSFGTQMKSIFDA